MSEWETFYVESNDLLHWEESNNLLYWERSNDLLFWEGLNNHHEETRLDVGRFTVVISVHAKCFEDLFIASRPTLPITRRVWEIL